jgi:hypothetical protein
MKKDTSGSLGQSDSQSIGQALGAEIEDGAKGFGAVNDGTGADAACVTLSGDVNDPDGDSIPNAAKLTFDCTSTTLGVTTTVTGTEMVTDDQPNAVAWAFTADANLHGAITAQNGASITTDRVGTIVGTQAGLVGPFALARTLDVTTTLTDARGASVDVTETDDWTLSYTPQATWTPGGIVVTGSLAASGMWHVTIGTATADATLATGAALTLTPTCETRVTAGSVSAAYEGGGHMNTVTVTWTGCGASTVNYAAH